MDFKDVLDKQMNDYTDDDVKVLSENRDKLSEDQLKTLENNDIKLEEIKKEESYSFGSKEEFEQELDKRLDDRDKKRMEENQREQDEKKDKDEMQIFDPNYKAKDWNDAFKTAMPKIIENVRNDVQKMNKADKQKYEDYNKQFDKELDDLRTAGKPIPQKGTQEWIELNTELGKIGSKYKQTTMTGAYDIYELIQTNKKNNSDKDEEPIPTPIEGETRKVPQKQKNLARKVSKKSGASGKSPISRSYNTLHTSSMDDLLEERKAQEGM